MDTIIYHQNCPDGFTAAYIAKQKYPEAQLAPRDHGAPINVEDYRGKDVLVVDCNLRGKNDEVAAVAKSYFVLDHHASETEIMNKDYAVYDVNRSGAGLAWDHLFGKNSSEIHTSWGSNSWGSTPQPRPWWVNYVEDRDLWRFRLPHSREINAFIMSHMYSIENWDQIAKMDIGDAIEAGEIIIRQNQKNAEEVALQAQYGYWNGHRTAVVNAPYLLASDVGEVLYLKPGVDIAAIWFERNDGRIQISLRSKPGTGPDVGAIAAKYPGGGGHKHAAGIPPTLEQGRKLIDTILGRTDEKLCDRITDYLSKGGLFNPELMEHEKVRDLLIDCRKALTEK